MPERAGRLEVDPGARTVRLSRIFDGYAANFGGQAGVLDFVARHLLDPEKRAFLEAEREPVRGSTGPTTGG